MGRNYSMNSSLPKDLGGAKFNAVIDDQSSVLDFALHRGIGAATVFSKVTAHAGIATHTQGSSAGSPTVVVGVGGVYLEGEDASPVSPGEMKLAQISKQGELYTTTDPKNYALTTASQEQVKSSSGILFGWSISGSGLTDNDVIEIKDGNNTVYSVVMSQYHTHFDHAVPGGGLRFNTDINVSQSISGGGAAASTTIIYR